MMAKFYLAHEFQNTREILNCKTLRCLVIIPNRLLLLYYVIHENKIIFIVIIIVIISFNPRVLTEKSGLNSWYLLIFIPLSPRPLKSWHRLPLARFTGRHCHLWLLSDMYHVATSEWWHKCEDCTECPRGHCKPSDLTLWYTGNEALG